MKTVELKVTGMHCVHCEANVANLLEQVEGVEKAVADRTHDRVLVRLTNDDLDVDRLIHAVESDPDKGFKAEEVKE